jgi:hypothetical protein
MLIGRVRFTPIATKLARATNAALDHNRAKRTAATLRRN